MLKGSLSSLDFCREEMVNSVISYIVTKRNPQKMPLYYFMMKYQIDEDVLSKMKEAVIMELWGVSVKTGE